MKNFAFHSVFRQKWLYYQILIASITYTFLYKRLGECTFQTLEWKGKWEKGEEGRKTATCCLSAAKRLFTELVHGGSLPPNPFLLAPFSLCRLSSCPSFSSTPWSAPRSPRMAFVVIHMLWYWISADAWPGLPWTSSFILHYSTMNYGKWWYQGISGGLQLSGKLGERGERGGGGGGGGGVSWWQGVVWLITTHSCKWSATYSQTSPSGLSQLTA